MPRLSSQALFMPASNNVNSAVMHQYLLEGGVVYIYTVYRGLPMRVYNVDYIWRLIEGGLHKNFYYDKFYWMWIVYIIKILGSRFSRRNIFRWISQPIHGKRTSVDHKYLSSVLQVNHSQVFFTDMNWTILRSSAIFHVLFSYFYTEFTCRTWRF